MRAETVRERYRAAGVCPSCGGVRKEGYLHCEKHVSDNRKKANKCWAKKSKEEKSKIHKSRKDYHRDFYLKRNYGITNEKYKELLHEQNGKCAICGDEGKEQEPRLHVDHNHITGEVRGLLCILCNFSIGGLREKKEYFVKALNYLGLSS